MGTNLQGWIATPVSGCKPTGDWRSALELMGGVGHRFGGPRPRHALAHTPCSLSIAVLDLSDASKRPSRHSRRQSPACVLRPVTPSKRRLCIANQYCNHGQRGDPAVPRPGPRGGPAAAPWRGRLAAGAGCQVHCPDGGPKVGRKARAGRSASRVGTSVLWAGPLEAQP